MVYSFKNKASVFMFRSGFFIITFLVFLTNTQAASPSFQRHFKKQDFLISNFFHSIQYVDPRINELEQKVRELNGTVEVLNHKLNEMQKEIQRLGGNVLSSQTAQTPQTSQSNVTTNQTSHGEVNKAVADDNNTHKTDEMQQGNLGTLKLDRTGDITGSTMDPSAQKSEQYDEALETVPDTKTAQDLLTLGQGYLKAHNYKAAESVLSALPLRFPESDLTGLASFYLGDALFAQHRYREAAQRYLAFYNEDPESHYQPENLLKLAKSMGALDDRSVACETLKSITEKYQKIDPQIVTQIKEEETQNKCQE